ASQRNTARTDLEPGLYDSEVRQRLESIGHSFTRNPEIGAATAVQRLPGGAWLAAAERERRGGGSAMVVRPDRKSTRLNSSHVKISYAVFCLKKKTRRGNEERKNIVAARSLRL